MTHDASKESNVGMVFLALSKLGDWQLIELHRGEEKRLSFYFIKAYHLATAGCVLQDNVFLPMAYLSFPDSVKVIQLWHGTGTIKKFGQDFNTGRLKRLEYRANQTITHLIVNAEGMKWLYQSAFGIAKEKIFALGLPRTDALFDKERRKKNREEFFKTYPNLTKKRLLLYAPTFRDREAAHPRLMLDTHLFLEMLPPEYVLGLRLHPFVAAAFSEEISEDRIINLSHYPDVNTLYEVSDALITDYSSVIFDYCILNKPIYFYAYDFEAFLKEGRGTYVNLKEDMPGVVIFSSEELFLEILKADYDYEKLRQFREESYQYLDGKSTERVVKLITG
jgi:CDP-ribitol ribitolphosphotransferase